MTAPATTRRELTRWAHQGGAKEGPSNTLAAMRCSLDTDPGRALEFDVHRNRAGEIVVIHDRTLDRTTDLVGRVARVDPGELARCNAGYWWVPELVDDHRPRPDSDYPYRGAGADLASVRVPTLDEVLAEFSGAPMTIEIKSYSAVRPTIDLLSRRRVENVTVTAFADWIVWLARLRLRDHPGNTIDLAPGIASTMLFWFRTVIGLPPRTSPYARLQIPEKKVVAFATPSIIGAAHATRRRSRASRRPLKGVVGIAVDVWTVDDEAAMRRLILRGIDGIMTDRPQVLRRVVTS